MPEQPAHEMVVALAGPAVNVVVAGLLYAWLLLNAGLEPLSSLSVTGGSFVERLMVVNLFLVGFNLIPAFPMDGGRVLRALLALRLEYARATQIAATVGQGIALLLGFAGLFGNPMLLFIALFVWIGAAQEASTAQMKAALGGIPVSGAMVTEFRTLTPGDSLAQAVELVLRGSQQDFPVVDGERVVGVLTRADLLRVLTEHGQSASVGATMQRDFQVVDAADMLETAFGQLQTCECHTLPVVQRGRLVGLVTTENVGEFLMIQAARKTRSHQAV
jgi:CBS domain-containing protein